MLTTKDIMTRCAIRHYTTFERLRERFNLQPASTTNTYKRKRLFSEADVADFERKYNEYKSSEKYIRHNTEVSQKLIELKKDYEAFKKQTTEALKVLIKKLQNVKTKL